MKNRGWKLGSEKLKKKKGVGGGGGGGEGEVGMGGGGKKLKSLVEKEGTITPSCLSPVHKQKQNKTKNRISRKY